MYRYSNRSRILATKVIFIKTVMYVHIHMWRIHFCAIHGYWFSDINECLSSRHGCEQVCVNTQGSYLCECNRDFALSSNGRSCSLDCGGSLSLSNGTLQSPGWPETYPELDFRCIWTLDNIPSGRSVAFVVDKSAYGIYGNSPCVRDYLEFFDAVGFSGESVGRYCGLVPPDPVVLAHEGVRIVFQGRVDSRRSEEHVGMSITYTILGETYHIIYT